jgi:hypothetical protein
LTASRGPEVVSVSPEADQAVVAAIAQALIEVWPKAPPPEREESPAWRFSGRWWAQPAALRRDRPLSTI